MSDPATQTIVGLGEVLWDCFPSGRRPGGAPANVAYHATQLGKIGIVCSRVGRDEPGEALRAYLSERGLSTKHVQQDDHRPTGTVTVDTSDANHPHYVIHEDVAWDHIAYTPGVAELMCTVDAVCFGTLAQRSPISAATISRALGDTAGALIIYDVNLREQWYTRETIARSLASCDVVKLNIDEVGVLNDLLELRASEARDFAERLSGEFDVDLVCITRGAAGCLLVDGGQVADIPGEVVTVVDAVGAGDAFCAAMITARLSGWPVDATARFANKVGALVATCAGAMPDVAERYAALREWCCT
jgi:fructokinase